MYRILSRRDEDYFSHQSKQVLFFVAECDPCTSTRITYIGWYFYDVEEKPTSVSSQVNRHGEEKTQHFQMNSPFEKDRCFSHHHINLHVPVIMGVLL